jgi:4-amino-4-deoxychorismate lyase
MNTAFQKLTMINDAFVDRLEVSDRGLAFGDGLFETLRLSRGCAPLWNFHLDRLEVGCARLGIAISRAHLDASFQRFVSAIPAETNAVLKLIVTRGSGGQGYRPLKTCSPTLIWQCLPLADTARLSRDGVVLHRCQLPIYPNPNLAGLKHLNRLDYVLAAKELPEIPDIQGLLLDHKGNLLEAIHHNLFFVKDNVLMTPRMSETGVKGVMRRVILERIAPACSLSVREDDFSVDALIQADEVFMSNSVRGIWPVKEFEQKSWAVPGIVTAQIQSQVEDIFTGMVVWQ